MRLFDADYRLLAEATCVAGKNCLEYTFPSAGGEYVLAIANAAGTGGQGYVYRMTLNTGALTDFNEPDDTIAQATPVTPVGPVWWYDYRNTVGYLSGCDDQDYYSFHAAAGQVFFMSYVGVKWQALDAAGTVLESSNSYGARSFTAPVEGMYYLQLYGACDTRYDIQLTATMEQEPNDTPAQAYPIPLTEQSEWFSGAFDSCADVDYYSFSGMAGDEISAWLPYRAKGRLLDSNLQMLDDGMSINAVLPADGTYYLQVEPRNANQPRCSYPAYVIYNLHLVDQPLYISFDNAGTVQGIKFTSGDVLRYWPRRGRWEMYLDVSDYGLKGNLTAFGLGDWESDLRFAMATTYKAGRVTITPQDLATISDYGPGMVVDGSDVGLTTSAERIDAVAVNADDCCWRLGISTIGRAVVPADDSVLRVENEDLGLLNMDYGGTDTSGQWSLLFDGSANGLAAVNVIGADSDRFENWRNGLYVNYHWFSFDKPVTLGGIRFDTGDIAQCEDSQFDHRNPCLTVTKFFDASDAGLVGLRVDALEVGRRR